MTIIHDLISVYNSLSSDRAFHSVIATILQNLPKIPELSLEETAELCNTSIITINRLLKQIHCPAFRTFKQQIAEVINGYSKHNRVFPYDWQMPPNDHTLVSHIDNYFSYLQNNIEDLSKRVTISQIETAADILHNAKDIHVYGLYAASHAKQQLQVDLMTCGKRYICFCKAQDIDKDAKTLDQNSAVIAQVIASYQNYSETIPVIKRILAQKIPIIIITSTKTLNNFQGAGCVLTFRGTDTAMDNHFIDMIYNLICITHRTKYIDREVLLGQNKN